METDYASITERPFKPGPNEACLEEMVVLERTCPFCGKPNSTVVPKAAWEAGKKLWPEHAAIQKAFPSFTPSQRELIMTGICDACWNNMQ